ncbi:MAG: homocysteine S-methyltransferase family protein [Syntrophaceae bacterium]|nr:homocysteine S-methyltransferase family protein [Syntrophaceae bacterium]
MKIEELLAKRIVVLDGAMGTELQKRGMPSGVSPEIWGTENPHVIQGIHETYLDAGADVIYTCTFGGNGLKLGQYGPSDTFEINRELAVIAKKASGGRGFIAGDIGPTGHFVEPFGDLGFDDAVEIFKEQARGLLAGGVDLFVIETMIDIQEARAALIAVKELTDIFTVVTMTYEKDGLTLNGTDPVAALITLQSLGANAVGCNCSTGPEEMKELIAAMKPYATVPLVAKPNAGMPELVKGRTIFNVNPEQFAYFGKELARVGGNLIGGCCGTTPDHIRELKAGIDKQKHLIPLRKSISALSSPRKAAIFSKENPVALIGERINPTGKKELQRELLEGKVTIVQKMAGEQAREGADLLDVNVGVAGIDQGKTMGDVVKLLATTSELPLVIDSTDLGAIERALRLYPGRALLNSISGEKKKMERFLPVAARYGAMFILLPLDDSGVPERAEGRIDIIQDVYEKARALGFAKEDIVVDGLVMAVSSNPDAPGEALKVVEWCSGEFGSLSVLGLSNVSFGMPERKWLNAAFLTMAMSKGVSMVIANPADEELIDLKIAADVLVKRDVDASRYISRFSKPAKEVKGATLKKEISLAERVTSSIMDGNREEIESLLKEAIESGERAERLLQEYMIPAITKVGQLFDRREYFLPQLLAGAETMKRGVAFLDPYLREGESAAEKKGSVVMATVKGDVHDIGKNIVSLMLDNHGFDVIDLGKDVPAERIVEEIKRSRPCIVGLSALMTTTMVNMREVIERAKNEGITCSFMVGGAVVNEKYALSIGAHYARDGVDAVRVAEALRKGEKSKPSSL